MFASNTDALVPEQFIEKRQNLPSFSGNLLLSTGALVHDHWSIKVLESIFIHCCYAISAGFCHFHIVTYTIKTPFFSFPNSSSSH